MRYQEYIDLGFERWNINCSVMKAETGYEGYSLQYQLTKTAFIEVVFSELDKRKLHLTKSEEFYNVIVDITEDIMLDLITKAKGVKS